MNFSDFLKRLKGKYGLKSNVELFNSLGGQEKLSMTMRNFSLIENGSLAPTITAFSSVFRQLEEEDYKDAITSFFQSNLEKSDNSKLIDYINNCLSHPIYRDSRSTSDKHSESELMFNSEQLSYLVEDIEAMKSLNKIGLFEKIDLESIHSKENLIKKLKTLKLVTQEGKSIRAATYKYRLPSFSDASSKNVRLASKLILNHIDAYLSEEGTIRQTFSYAFHLLTQHQSKMVLTEVNRIKTLISTFASTNAKSDVLIPFLYVGFGKEVEKKEFD
jgi:hypothetical protein